MSYKCLKLDLLKSFLSNFDHTLELKPNGQNMYKFNNELIINVYETGSVVFQGHETSGILAQQVTDFINSVNAPFVSQD
jgi:ribonuclease HIII